MGMFGVRRLSVLRMCSQALLAAVLLGSSTPAVAQLIERVSVSSAEVVGNNRSLSPSISAHGRYVAFTSFASNVGGVYIFYPRFLRFFRHFSSK